MALATATLAMMATSVAGAAIQAGAASKAANAQKEAADAQIELQREVYEDQTRRFEPFYTAGQDALDAYRYEIGLLNDTPMIGGQAQEVTEVPGQAAVEDNRLSQEGDGTRVFRLVRPTEGGGAIAATPSQWRVGDRTFATREEAEAFARTNRVGGSQYRGIELSPAAQFAVQQGMGQLQGAAAMRSGLHSGATMAGLERMRFGMAAGDRDNQLNRIAGMVDMGQGSAGMQAQSGNAFAQMASNSLANMGNAQAAGAIGQGNAWSNMFGQLGGIIGYQQSQRPA